MRPRQTIGHYRIVSKPGEAAWEAWHDTCMHF